MTERTYWASFYSNSAVPSIPSQFAAFALGEASGSSAVVDIGCGNGRDATFFARQGIRTLAIDASDSAVQACRAASEGLPLTVMQSDVGSLTLLSEVNTWLGGAGEVLLYARFFVHALTDNEEAQLLVLAKQVLARRRGMFALEFRTHRDQSLEKVTAAHFRRFINPTDFARRSADSGFEVRYFVEGFGYAKYRNDDAHVARFLLSLQG